MTPVDHSCRGFEQRTINWHRRSLAAYASDAPLPTPVQILNGAKPAKSAAIYVDIAPDSEWRYSGGGFIVTRQLLLDVTGKPFPAFMKETVLGPAGMATALTSNRCRNRG